MLPVAIIVAIIGLASAVVTTTPKILDIVVLHKPGVVEPYQYTPYQYKYQPTATQINPLKNVIN